MTYVKLIELEEKFSKKIAQNDEESGLQDQRSKLSKFYHKFTRELYSLINEMDGDALVLKEKGLSPDLLKMFNGIKGHITSAVKQINPYIPYDGAMNLIEWANQKETKATLNNLNFIIQEFLKTNEVEFKVGPHLNQVRVESITKLKNILKNIHEYIKENPLSDSKELPTVPPPARRMREDEETVILPSPNKKAI